MDKKLDLIDKRILDELQNNGRITIVDLAEKVNLSKTPCAERVKRLEKNQLIKGYHAELNAQKLGLEHMMLVQVTLNQSNTKSLHEFNHAIKKIDEVQSCFMVAANFDYLLIVRTYDIQHFREILGDQIGNLPCVQQTHSFVVMEEVSNGQSLAVLSDSTSMTSN